MYTPYNKTNELLEDYMIYINILIYIYIKDNSDNNNIDKILINIINNDTNENNLTLLNEYSEKIRQKIALTKDNEIYIPLIYIFEVFNLDEFEILALVISILYNNNSSYRKLFSIISDNYNDELVIDIVIKLFSVKYKFDFPIYEIINLKNDIYKYLFINNEDCANLVDTKININSKILDFIFENERNDNLYYNTFFYYKKIDNILYNIEYVDSILENMDKDIIYICGKDGLGKKFIIKNVAVKSNKNITFVDMNKLINNDYNDFTKIVNEIICELILQQGYLCIYNTDIFIKNTTKSYIDYLLKEVKNKKILIFILSTEYIICNNNLSYSNYKINYPDRLNRYKLWEKFIEDKKITDDINLQLIANKFVLTPRQIKNAIYQAFQNNAKVNKDILISSCYNQSTDKLKQKSTVVNAVFDWDDLILSNEYKNLLKQACNHVDFRHIVYDKWKLETKLPYGKGLSILFEGPPGTGKTMAAQIVSKQIGLKLYKISLSSVVSKYIGETEKNLNEIFDEATNSNSILFFDETDALFSKRLEVKDSQDKYANIEVAFLLQKIEQYDGVIIMATNYLKNIDEAFMRRINYVIHFPFPDSTARVKIWKSIFPPEMPIDDKIDFEYLSKTFEISGASIKNSVVAAAFMAAANNDIVNMKYLLKSIINEITKQGKIVLNEDLKEYNYLLK